MSSGAQLYVSLLGTLGAGAALCGLVAYVLGRSARRFVSRRTPVRPVGATISLEDGPDRSRRVDELLDQYEASLRDTLEVFVQIRTAAPGARREALLAERGEIMERRLDQRAVLSAELVRVAGRHRARSGGAS
jgi:hypothetical protein